MLLDGSNASCHVAQDGTHVFWLLVGEAQGREAGGSVGLVAQMVPSLLGGSAVVAQAVGLDNQPQIRPKEVDSKPLTQTLVSGTGRPTSLASGRKSRSRRDRVKRKVRRSSQVRKRATPGSPG